MTKLEFLFCVTVLLVSLLSAVWTFYTKYRLRKTMEHMAQMIDAATMGTFCEDVYDESLLSFIETKLAQRKRKHQETDCRYFPSDKNSNCQYPALFSAALRKRPAKRKPDLYRSIKSAGRETEFSDSLTCQTFPFRDRCSCASS